MPTPKTKNPARVDAAVRQHLRRMDRSLRVGVIVFVTSGLLSATLILFPPTRSKRLAAVGALSAAISLLVSLFSGLGVLSLRVRRKTTRGKLMRTCQCGYDLRATDDACPECGTPIPDALRRAREAQLDKQYIGPNRGIDSK